MKLLYIKFFATLVCLIVYINSNAQNIRIPNKPNNETFPSGTVTNQPSFPNDLTGTDKELHYIRKDRYKFKTDNPYNNNNQFINRLVNYNVINAAGETVMEVSKNAVINGSSSGNLVKLYDKEHTRISKTFPAYSFNPTGSQIYELDAFSKLKLFYNDRFPNEQNVAINNSVSGNTANKRSVKTFTSGKKNIGQGKYSEIIATANTFEDSVRIWSFQSNQLKANGFYASKSLLKQITINEEGMLGVVFTNRMNNKPILERKFNKLLGIDDTLWNETYYVYDDFDRLIYIVQPKVLAAYPKASFSFALTALEIKELCFEFKFDAKGRLYQERKPGEDGFTTKLYNKNHQVVGVQEPIDIIDNRWKISFFDRNGRAIASGLFTAASSATILQQQLDNDFSTVAHLGYFFNNDNGIGLVPTEGLSLGSFTNFYLLSETIYDNIQHYFNKGYNDILSEVVQLTQSANLSATAYNNDSTAASFTNGLIVANRTRILPNEEVASNVNLAEWKNASHVYNRNYSPLYGGTEYLNNSNQVIYQDYFANYYDHLGKVLLNHHFIKNDFESSGLGRTILEKTIFEYDYFRQQLLGIKRQLNDTGSYVYTLKNFYDELGRLKQEILGNNSEFRDYTYTIQGRLSGINEVYALTGNKPSGPTTFGQVLRYDFGSEAARLDGKVATMIWRGSDRREKHSYTYSYDNIGNLHWADYFNSRSGAAWNTNNHNYTVEDITYDRNGNIQTMKQWGVDRFTVGASPFRMDQLVYSYANNSNKLINIKDYINHAAPVSLGDLRDNNDVTTTGLNDYVYDAAGNLTEDRNKGIIQIKYNILNMPSYIEMANGGVFKYVYDAGGNKLYEFTSKVVGDEITEETKTYVSNAVYKNDTMQFVTHSTGRDVLVGDNYNREFFVKDHLQNVRSIVNYEAVSLRPQEYLGSYEIAARNIESIMFNTVADVADVNPIPVLGNELAGRLNVSDDKIIGTSIMLKVMAGDVFEASTETYYDDSTVNHSAINTNDVLNSLSAALLDNHNAANDESGHAKTLLAGILDNNFQLGDQLDQLFEGSYDVQKPAAFLNYVLFDQDYNVVPGASGVVQAVGGNGAWNAISTAQDIAIEQNGYLLVYLSTQVTTDVYFDNLNIKLKSGNLLEETHYYPFGLPIHNLGTAAAQQKENRLKYQSNEYIEDNDLRWMNFNARQYDPQIGRFLSIDPLAYVGGQQVHSPYAAMGNNPGMMIDPNGTRSKYANDPNEGENAALLDYHFAKMFGNNKNASWFSIGNFGMNLESAGGGGGFNVGSNVFSNFGKVVRKFFSLFGNKASSNVEPSTGNNASSKVNDSNNKVEPDEKDYSMLETIYFTDKKLNWFNKTFKSILNFVRSLEVEANVAYSYGLQAGVEFKTPVGVLGVEANALSVELVSSKAIFNGEYHVQNNHIGNDNWMNLKQSAGINLILGGVSFEREMRSPTGGGGFYDKKVTEEANILWYNHKKEYYQDGIQTQPQSFAPTYSNGLKFGASIQFLFGFKFDLEIRKRK